MGEAAGQGAAAALGADPALRPRPAVAPLCPAFAQANAPKRHGKYAHDHRP